MRLFVLLIVSLTAWSSADILQVKCGDEKCERPSNKAVTTLRYTPDKPYKLSINSVNSEVEIFGVTDDLFYIRHGKNFGFLPKAILRENSRGNFPFSIEIDLGSRRIDQTVRQQNFLFEFIKTSQIAQEVKTNDTVTPQILDQVQPAPVHEQAENEIPAPSQETASLSSEQDTAPKAESQEKVAEIPLVPLDSPNDKQPETVTAKSVEEEENDSGVEEDDEEEEDDDDEEEEEDSQEEKATEKPKQVELEQPELLAIPPGKDTESVVKSEEAPKVEDKPKALPVAASLPEESINQPSLLEEPQNQTVESNAPEPIKEIVPEFVPIKEPDMILDAQIDIDNYLKQSQEKLELVEEKILAVEEKPAVVEEKHVEVEEKPAVVEEKHVEVEEKPAVVEESINTQENVTESEQKTQNETAVEPPINQMPVEVQEPFIDNSDNNTVASSEPEIETAPLLISEPDVVEQVEIPTLLPPINDSEKPEYPTVEPTDQNVDQKVEIPNVPLEVISPFEEAPKEPLDDLPVMQEIPVVTPVPEIVPAPEVPAAEIHEPTTLPIQQKPQPDALLQKFNEKLGNKGAENSGKGSVELLHPGHDHNHGHEHHNHDHSQEQVHRQEQVHKEPELPIEVDKPGFFGGIYNSFFGDKGDSDQHYDQKANVDNAFNPAADQIADGYCEKVDSENCPESLKVKREINSESAKVVTEWKTAGEYLRVMLDEAIGMMDLIISMGLTALTVLIFTLGYYCIVGARKEGPLIAKMNALERHLMSSVKENEMLKGEIMATKQKLMSIEDNSFGSNDMVIALKKDLEATENMRVELSEKVGSLEKELEAAAEDGLELNRMVSELLNNQTGSESIISSVEDLQRQLNEQQETIVTMNETLALKSRENSELQVQLSEINGKFQGDFQTFEQQINAVVLERTNLQIELENLKRETDLQVNQLVEERNSEVTRLNAELTSYSKKYEDIQKSSSVNESKVQALEECLKAVKKDSKGTSIKDLFDVAELKADLLAVSKEKNTMQEKLQNEKDSRQLLDDRVKSINEEMSNLKKEFGVAEKEKLEAQTRLEVLSTYFKEKETQLQQELSLKEARWMQQQGETTSTVEKVQALNDEIQSLKSQNDSLRVEIEAQVAAHKLNISSLEGQSHAAWLNARQAERRLEESRMESAALRRRLTSIAETPAGSSDLLNGLPGMINDTIPSPIRVESPNALPPAPMMMPPFLPQGFMPGAPLPFVPPPPFMPSGEMGPPLGRLMSPPPKRFTPTMRDDRDRYSPRGRGRYSPDSRYDDYTAFETETDYSPPPSPSPPRRGYNSPLDRSKKSKGGHSSGSIDSDRNPTSRRK